jgi:glycosyltransferase involved in cell wall biosynthesis
MGVAPGDARPTVLVVTHNYPRDPEDQAGQFIHTLITPIADRYRFVVVAPHHAGLPLEENLGPVAIRRFRYGSDADETLAYGGNMHEQVLKNRWSKGLLLLRFLRSMRRATARAIDAESPVVMHIHWWIPCALATGGLAVRHRVPYILTTHGSDVTLLNRFAWLRPVARTLFRRAAARTAVSSYLQGLLRETLDVDSVVFPMPYDDRKFRPAPPADRVPPVVTCIGRLIERKGQDRLIDATRKLLDRGIDLRLQLVGDGPQRAGLEERAAGLGIADRVIFTGNVPHQNIPAAIAASALVVLPSVKDWKGEVEGLGMVLAEASACARPVIGTRLGGPIDAVDEGKSGFLVPPGDSDALADAMAKILADPGLGRRLGEAGAAFAREHFSPAGQAARLASIIDRIRRP